MPDLPRHVGIIMDGNGRWAQARGLSRIEGHRRGADAVRRTVRAARQLGVRVLTLFAFSEQNWSRPRDEVEALMDLLLNFLHDERGEILDNDIRLLAIGDLARLPTNVRAALDELCAASDAHRSMTLCLALSYGGREDVVRAARRIARSVAEGRLRADDVSASVVDASLESRDLGDLDLLIRTSGEMRLSNFLLWPAAYAELWFTEKLWPDFDRADFAAALDEYRRRQRRFGLTAEQVR